MTERDDRAADAAAARAQLLAAGVGEPMLGRLSAQLTAAEVREVVSGHRGGIGSLVNNLKARAEQKQSAARTNEQTRRRAELRDAVGALGDQAFNSALTKAWPRLIQKLPQIAPFRYPDGRIDRRGLADFPTVVSAVAREAGIE